MTKLRSEQNPKAQPQKLTVHRLHRISKQRKIFEESEKRKKEQEQNESTMHIDNESNVVEIQSPTSINQSFFTKRNNVETSQNDSDSKADQASNKAELASRKNNKLNLMRRQSSVTSSYQFNDVKVNLRHIGDTDLQQSQIESILSSTIKEFREQRGAIQMSKQDSTVVRKKFVLEVPEKSDGHTFDEQTPSVIRRSDGYSGNTEPTEAFRLKSDKQVGGDRDLPPRPSGRKGNVSKRTADVPRSKRNSCSGSQPGTPVGDEYNFDRASDSEVLDDLDSLDDEFMVVPRARGGSDQTRDSPKVSVGKKKPSQSEEKKDALRMQTQESRDKSLPTLKK